MDQSLFNLSFFIDVPVTKIKIFCMFKQNTKLYRKNKQIE